MEIKNIKGEDVKILSIILTESDFKRLPQVTVDPSEIDNKINVNVNVQLTDNILVVTETLSYSQNHKTESPDIQEVYASVKYVGIYEFKEGNEYTEDQKNTFGRINGGAMLFHYIREHLSVTSQKAGIRQVILPPLNFTTLGKTDLTIEDPEIKGK